MFDGFTYLEKCLSIQGSVDDIQTFVKPCRPRVVRNVGLKAESGKFLERRQPKRCKLGDMGFDYFDEISLVCACNLQFSPCRQDRHPDHGLGIGAQAS